jgi:hypothetical protein
MNSSTARALRKKFNLISFFMFSFLCSPFLSEERREMKMSYRYYAQLHYGESIFECVGRLRLPFPLVVPPSPARLNWDLKNEEGKFAFAFSSATHTKASWEFFSPVFHSERDEKKAAEGVLVGRKYTM